MEKHLDFLIKILEESLSTEDLTKISELEKEFQNLTENIKKIQNDPSIQEFEIDKEKLNHFSSLIKKFEARQAERKNFLKEFNDFLRTRKFK